MKQKKEKNIAAETSNQTLNSVNNITLDLISNNIEVEMLILCIFSWYWLTVSSTNRLSILLTFHIELSVLKKKFYVHGWIAEVCGCLALYWSAFWIRFKIHSLKIFLIFHTIIFQIFIFFFFFLNTSWILIKAGFLTITSVP